MSNIDLAYTSLCSQLSEQHQPNTAIILGSGLGELLGRFNVLSSIEYQQIEGFPTSTAPSHAGNLHFVEHNNGCIMIFEGRFHPYEGWSAMQSVMPVYLAYKMGVSNLVITNAVGALRQEFEPAEVFVVSDHINFTGLSPLVGQNDHSIGSRFPDMSQPYCSDLRAIARHALSQHNITFHEGIYAGVLGPELETSAQRRFLKQSGCDVVGMSLVLECVAANHCGMNVLALSAITNSATGDENQQPDSIDEVLANAKIAGDKISLVLPDILSQLN